jgi:hypothetical protein
VIAGNDRSLLQRTSSNLCHVSICCQAAVIAGSRCDGRHVCTVRLQRRPSTAIDRVVCACCWHAYISSAPHTHTSATTFSFLPTISSCFSYFRDRIANSAVKMATSMLKTNANVRLTNQRRGQMRLVATRRMVVRAQAAATEDRIKIGINGESRKLCQSLISRAQSLINVS